jgi:transcriptional regulator with XRE-family HTH domain
MPREKPEDPADVARDVGRKIQELRRAAGLTQEEAATKLGMTVRALAYIEAGARNLTLRALTEIALILGTKTIELLKPPLSREVRQGRPPKDAGAKRRA